MIRRIIIISSGALLTSFCIVAAVLTLLGLNPATSHLSKFLVIGYAAITAVLAPFGLSGVIGGFSRKKALIRTFVTFHWWTSTFILIGLNAANIVLIKRDKGDFIRRCQADLAKGQPDANFLARCTASANNNERFTLIATFSVGGVMLFLGIILLIVGTREYSSIRSEEEAKNLISSKTDTLEEIVSSDTSNNDGGAIDEAGRFNNFTRMPPNSASPVTSNVDLTRRPTYVNNMSGQYTRQPTSPRNQEFMTPYQGLNRNQTIPVVPRYPANGLTRQQTNGYAPRNYIGAQQQTYPMAPQRSLSTKQYIEPPQRSLSTKQYIEPPQRSLSTKQYTEPPQRSLSTKQYTEPPQRSLSTKQYTEPPQRSLSTKQYIEPPQPSYVTQIVIPPPKPVTSEINNNNDYYIRKPYKNTTTPYIPGMGMN